MQGLVSSLGHCSGFNSRQMSLMLILSAHFSRVYLMAHGGVCFLEVLPGLEGEVASDSVLHRLDAHSHPVPSFTCKLCVPFSLGSWRRGFIGIICPAFCSPRKRPAVFLGKPFLEAPTELTVPSVCLHVWLKDHDCNSPG